MGKQWVYCYEHESKWKSMKWKQINLSVNKKFWDMKDVTIDCFENGTMVNMTY